jgi:hypothetical protein
MPQQLRQSERFESYPNPEKVEHKDFATLLKSEDLIDSSSRKKTVYLLGGNLHSHELTSEPVDNEVDTKSFLLTWSDREKFNELDIAIKVIYHPESQTFEPVSTSADVKNSIIEGDQYIKPRVEIIREIENQIKEIITTKTFDKLELIDKVEGSLWKMDRFKKQYSNYEGIINSGNIIEIQIMLNLLIRELQETNKIALDERLSSSNCVEDLYSDLLRTVEQVKDGLCIKNPSQSQVLRMVRENALANLN